MEDKVGEYVCACTRKRERERLDVEERETEKDEGIWRQISRALSLSPGTLSPQNLSNLGSYWRGRLCKIYRWRVWEIWPENQTTNPCVVIDDFRP